MKKGNSGLQYKAVKDEQDENFKLLMQNEIDELKDAIRYLEHQLVDKKKEMEDIFRQLKDAQTTAGVHENNYNRETGITKVQGGKITDLERKLKEQKEGHDDFIGKAQNKINDFQNEISSKEEELASMRARLHQKAEELKVAEIGAVTNQNKAQRVISDSNKKDQEISSLKQEIKQLKQELMESQATRKSEGTALLEIEHIKADNERLVKLLKGTKEYKQFGKFAEDNLSSVRYMHTTKRQKCGFTNCAANTEKENVNANLEDENWIPQEAFDIAYTYKQHGNELTDSLINKLLKTLNLVWRDRERRHIARVKNNCNHQIQKLRRQITHTAPLAEVTARGEITRLKTQLADTHKKLRQNVILRKKNVQQAEITEHVETAFKIAGDLQDERNKVIQENKMLKVRLQDAEKLQDNEDYERAKFMQGAAWQATKSLNENKDLQEKVEALIAEFKEHERNLYLKGDTTGLQLFRQKNHEIVLEEIQSTVNDTNEKFKKMMEVATEHFSASQNQVDVLGGRGSFIPYTK